MNILGMGPMELLLIVVLALIVFGPARLPEIMAQVGKAIGDFRRATSELSDEFNRTIQAELQETRAVVDETKATFTDAKTSIYEAHASVSSAITGTPAPVRTAVPGESLPPPNGTSAGPHTDFAHNGAVPQLAPPPALADTTQWSWETSPSTPPATPSPGQTAGTTAPLAMTGETIQSTPDPAPAASVSPREHTPGDELLPPY